MLYGTENYFFYFILYSVLGWGYETVLCSVRERTFVNRGFLNGPYCPIYGIGSVLFLSLLGNEKNAILIFILGAIIASAIEYVTSLAMEKAFGARWWDYSEFKFNLDGRICLGAATVFGAFAVALIKFLHPAVMLWARNIPPTIFHAVNAVLAITFICDLWVTLRGFKAFNGKLRDMTERLSSALATDEEEKAKNALFATPISRQQRRLMRALPNMKSIKYGDALKNMRIGLNNNQKGL